jgi:2-amino-4-hydroxy-6-hydroxymethyldihydropteridine diphosphokinase
MSRVYLLLGSNRGDRLKFLMAAVKKIESLIGTVTRSSSVYETEPWGFEDQTQFLNQLVVAGTSLEPSAVLTAINSIEQQLGRERKGENYAARTIDIDILFFEERIINTEELVIPHPRLHERRFALAPLAEIEKGLVHPVFKKTVAELLAECKDLMKVQKI